MSKKAKPRWGWEDAGSYCLHFFSDDEFNKIEKKLPNVELTKDIRLQLQEAAATYRVDAVRIPQIPRLSEVKAALTEIHSKAEVLIERLKEIDTISLGKLYAVAFPNNLELLGRIQNKSSEIHKLHSIVQDALNRLKPDRGGRRKEKQPLRGLIWHLICIYESSTGTKATLSWTPYEEKYTSKFYDFTQTVMEIIDPEAKLTNSSLGQQIKVAIKLLKSSSKEDILQSLQRVPTIR